MTAAAVATPPAVERARGTAVVPLVGALLLITWFEVAIFAYEGISPIWPVALVPATGLVYAVAGAVAWLRRPDNWLGAIMMTGTLFLLMAGLASTDVPELSAIGIVTATAPLAVVVHLLHAFPAGRVRTPLSRWTVAVAYGTCLVLQIPLYLFAPSASPHGMLAVADRPGWADAGSRLQSGVGIAVMVVTAAILAKRLSIARPRQRRVLGPMYVYGIAAVLAVPLIPDVLQPLIGFPRLVTGVVQVLLLAAVPVLFATAVLRGGFARTSAIEELAAWLGTAPSSRPALADVLASALGDESVQLAFRVSGSDGPAGSDVDSRSDCYVDATGRTLSLPSPGSGRGRVDIDTAGRRTGAIFYDAELIDEPDLVRAAGQVIALAVDQQRLAAELRASQRQLQLSRARLVEACDQERRRITQNLHDGLQAELVLLAVEAQRLANLAGTPAATASAATRLRVRIDHAAAGLRDLVYAVMPAPLIERGLVAAAEDLVDRMPVPTSLYVGLDGPLPPPVQSTAYFLIAEALSNAIKHGSPTKIVVRLTQLDDSLLVEVDDNGAGGARVGAGLGLRGLAGRINVLEGKLRIESPIGGGTRIIAELPCES